MSTGNPIELEGIKPLQRALKKLGDDNRKDLLDQVGALVDSQTMNRIRNLKQTPEGKPWRPLSKEYAKWKAKVKGAQVGLLEFEGHLRDSITHIASRDEVEIGSVLPYASSHQYGEGVPARPFMGLSQQDRDDIEELVLDYMKALVK